jgi:phage RecT family recombinase
MAEIAVQSTSDGAMMPFIDQVVAACGKGLAFRAIKSVLESQGRDVKDFLSGIDLYYRQNEARVQEQRKKNPSAKSLAECTFDSNVDAIRQLAGTGLSVNVTMEHFDIVPFGDKATLVVKWKGLVAQMLRARAFDMVTSHFVYAGEEFRVAWGTEETITHIPNLDMDGREDWIAVYAVGHKGNLKQSVCWSREHMNKFHKGLKMKGPVWGYDFSAMARKTMIRRLADMVDRDSTNPMLNHHLNIVDALDEGREPPTERATEAVVGPRKSSGTAAVAGMMGLPPEPEPTLEPRLKAAQDKYRLTGEIDTAAGYTDDEMKVILG